MSRMILTIGTFDGLHAGHVNLINRCRAIAGTDKLYVGLNTDTLAKSRGKKLLQSFDQRRSVINALRAVDGSIAYNGTLVGLEQWITYFKARYTADEFVLVVGTDWVKKYHKLMHFTPKWLERNRVTVVYVDHTDGVSSTQWRKNLEHVKRQNRRTHADKG